MSSLARHVHNGEIPPGPNENTMHVLMAQRNNSRVLGIFSFAQQFFCLSLQHSADLHPLYLCPMGCATLGNGLSQSATDMTEDKRNCIIGEMSPSLRGRLIYVIGILEI